MTKVNQVLSRPEPPLPIVDADARHFIDGVDWINEHQRQGVLAQAELLLCRKP
jgi:hypothetical protein